MSSIVIFLLVLSFLVFVHELGHFLAAKACNIYVDRFSIGMPPRIAGFKWGETDYCIGALPIGGYVKMAGQEDAPLSEEEREKDYGTVPPERWFSNKPVWQRLVVLIAGPLANLVLAVVLYGLLAAIGEEVPKSMLEPRIGKVDSAYPAASAALYEVPEGQDTVAREGKPDAIGWKTGDVILRMNGAPIENIIPDLAMNATLHGDGRAHEFLIERTHADGTTTRYSCAVTPARNEGDKYPRFGVEPFSSVLVANILEDTPAAEAGLQPDDIVTRANGEIVDRTTFIELTQDFPEGESLDLMVARGGETLHLTLTPRTVGKFKSMALSAPAQDPEPESSAPMVALIEKSFSEKTGLQRKDRIVSVNGRPMGYEALSELVMESPGETLQVEVERPSILFGLLQRRAQLTLDLPVDDARAIGIAIAPELVFHRVPPSQVVPEAFRKSYQAVHTTLLTIKGLIVRDVSPKDLGGPVMIFQVTRDAAQMGFGRLVFFTALISINLFVFNLLPLPVLDGGQILINGLEAIRRKPISMVVLERYQTAGLFLIIGLMLYVTWNDVGRLISDLLP